MLALTSEDLVEEDFDVVWRQVLGRHDDLVEVTLQQLGDHVTEEGVKETTGG